MKKRTIIILAVIGFALAGGGWYAYREFTRKVKDLSGVKPDLEISAPELIAAFETDEVGSNERFLDKVVAVRGSVGAVEKNDKGHFTVILRGENGLSSVRCSMDSIHQDEVATLPEGSLVTMKGACTGFTSDELLGSDVILNRSVLQKD